MWIYWLKIMMLYIRSNNSYTSYFLVPYCVQNSSEKFGWENSAENQVE